LADSALLADDGKKIIFIINPISSTRKKDLWPEVINQNIDTSYGIRIFSQKG
jgi:hypothetical protein